MASRHSLCLLLTTVLLLAGSAAFAQGTAAPPTSSAPPTTEASSAAAQQAPTEPRVEQNREPEWRWRALTAGGDFAMTSAYVWRGFVLHEGACVQPDLWVKVGDFTVMSWLNVRNSIAGDNHLNEHDVSVDYSHDVGRVTLSAGWTNYQFFGHEGGRTNEFYAGVGADVLLQPAVKVYQDVQQGTGTYVSLSAGHEWPMGKRVTGGAQVAVGYNNHLYIDGAGFSDVAITLKVSLPLPSARAELQPTVTYSHNLMPENPELSSRLFGGLAIAFK